MRPDCQARIRTRGCSARIIVRLRSIKVRLEDASGTDALRTTIPAGKFSPETSAEFSGAPVVALYSPIVPARKFVTNKFPPDNATSRGPFSPEISAGFIGAPVVGVVFANGIAATIHHKDLRGEVPEVAQSTAETATAKTINRVFIKNACQAAAVSPVIIKTIFMAVSH